METADTSFEAFEKAADLPAVNVTPFVKRVIERGTGLHLLEYDDEKLEWNIIDEPFTLPQAQTESVNSICRKVLEVSERKNKSVPFVIRLPDERLIASCKLERFEKVLFLTRGDGYLDEIAWDWSLVNVYHNDNGKSSLLSLAEIDSVYVSQLNVVGKRDYGTSQDNSFVVRNMARLYFRVYEGTTTEQQAARKARSSKQIVSAHVQLPEFFTGNNRFYDKELVDYACSDVYTALSRETEVIRHFRKSYFCDLYEQHNVDLSQLYPEREDGTIAVGFDKNQIMDWKSKVASVKAALATEVLTKTSRTSVESSSDLLFQSIFAALENIGPWYIRDILSLRGPRNKEQIIREFFKSTWEKITDLSRRSVTGLLSTKGFRSRTSHTESPRIVNSTEFSTVWRETERKAVIWLLKAQTCENYYQQAAEFLLEQKLDSPRALAEFICISRPVEGAAANLKYVIKHDHPIEIVDESNWRWTGMLGALIDHLMDWMAGIKSTFWCTRGAVTTWSVSAGLMLHIPLAILVALAVAIGVKTREPPWEVLEVALNLILTGAVAIVLGTLSFETGGRQVVIDSLLFQRALREIEEWDIENGVLKELTKMKHPHMYVRESSQTWISGKGQGFTRLPEEVPFDKVSKGGCVKIGNFGMSAKICRRERKISVNSFGVLEAKEFLERSIDPETLTRRKAFVRVSNPIR